MIVINGKRGIKYLVGITITIVIIVGLTRFFSSQKEEKLGQITQVTKQAEEHVFLSCFEGTIPGMKEVNEKDADAKNENEQNNKKDPLKTVMDSELKVLTSVRGKQERKEKQEEEKKMENSEKQEVEHAQTGIGTEVIPNNVPNKFTNNYQSVQVKNETSYHLTEDMLNPNVTVNNQNFLLFHTHTCESYTPTPNFQYEASGTFRTTDLNYSVARVGTELQNQLQSYGYQVVHDMTYHDYPAYTGSYGRSMTTVENLLKEHNNTDVVIDLHRDAIGDTTYAPTVKIGGEEAAQLMFVIGTDGGGLEHPNWVNNLKFAIKIQEKANELYPGLFKPIILRNSRYNQQLASAASIIEVGATGNTMEQCLTSMKYIAKVFSEVMK